VQKKKPDGTVVRVRRRVMRLTVVKKNGSKQPVDETPLEYEETELEENSPELENAFNDSVRDSI